MLNLTEIAKRIAQPSLCSIDEIDDLKNFCVTYPYSQLFPLLYLSTLARHNDIRFDQELERLAYTISDRSMLYSLINSSQGAQSTEITTEIIEEEIEIPTPIVEKEEIIEEPIKEVEIETPIIPEITEFKDPIQIKEEIREENIVPEEEIVVDVETQEPIEVETEQTTETTDSEIIAEHEVKETIEKETKSFEDLLTAQTIAASYSLEKEEQRIREIEQLKKQLEQPITPSEFVEPIVVESKKSFSSWLTANENYKQPIEEKVNVNDLISKFIEDSPKLKPAEEKLFEGRKERKEFFSPTKKAKESLDEQQLPVSETLAKIFAAQGNFPKAIYAYQQLMLIIPEKKIFFAVQIKELQKKLNN